MNGTRSTSFSERLIAVILAVLMIATVIPGQVFAAADDGVSVAFKVTDANGAPISSAAVKVGTQNEKLTDGNGEVTISSLTEGREYNYTVSCHAYAEASGSFTAETEAEIDVSLTALETTTISGHVKDENGDGIEGATVTITGYETRTTQTMSGGIFLFNTVYVWDSYMLEVSKSGYVTGSFTAKLGEDNELVLNSKQPSQLSFDNPTLTIKYGETVVNIARNQFGDVATGYYSQNSNVATVDNNGKITPTGVGFAVIRATIGETSNALASEGYCQVTVEEGVQAELGWRYSIPTDLTWRDTFINTVTGGSGDGAVTYSSGDTTIANVDAETGLVTFNKPGTVTITAVKDGGELYENATTEYTITAHKAPGAELTFNEPHPDSITFGQTYANIAVYAGDASAQIIYWSADETIATVDAKGLVTPVSAGVVKIYAKVVGDEYTDDSVAEYEIGIVRAGQDGFRFDKINGEFTIKYGEEFVNAATGGMTVPVTYSSSDRTVATVDSNGRITTVHPGTATITATNPESNQYEAGSISYELTVEKADQDVVFETPSDQIPVIAYGETFSNPATALSQATNEASGIVVTYASSDEEVATVDANGVVTAVGVGAVTITAAAASNDYFNEAEASYSIQIKKAEQTVTFTKTSPCTVRFNDNENEFINVAETSADPSNDNTVVYSIVEGADYAEIPDENSATVKIKGAAERIVVRATFSGNANYEEASGEYLLVVEKSEQQISFPSNTYTVTLGNQLNPCPAIVLGEHVSTGDVTYSIVEQTTDHNKTLLREFNSQDGSYRITKGFAGTAIIKASKAGDDNYNPAEATYTLYVVEQSDAIAKYRLEGDKASNTSEWYISDVKIIAEDGYQVSFYSDDSDDYDWQSELLISDNGENTVNFKIMSDTNQGISPKITLTIKIDKELPQVSLNAESITAWDKILEIISFGAWGKNYVTVTVNAVDEVSGVSGKWYYIGDINTAAQLLSKAQLDSETDWIEIQGNDFTVGKDFANVFYVKVKDVAGNCTYANTNGIIFDGTDPKAEFILPAPATQIDVDGAEGMVGLYGDDIDISVKLTDAEPHSGVKSAEYWVECDGQETTDHINIYEFDMDQFGDQGPTYSDLVGEVQIDNLTISAADNNSDDVVICVMVTDNADNTETYRQRVAFSTTAPEIFVTYINDPTAKNEYNDVFYFDSDRCAKVEVIGRHSAFVPENVVFNVNEYCGDTDNGPTYSIDKWTVEGDTHIAYISFNGSAQYSYGITYSDAVGHSAASYISESFAVDHDDPHGTVSIDENEWDELIETLTFGLWKNEAVQVNATADDATSPIKSIEYYKTDSTEAYTNTMLEEVEWTPFEAFTVDSNEQFTVYIKITDYAEHYIFISSNGYIVDMEHSEIVLTIPDPNGFGFYNNNVTVDVSVHEPDPASGIDKIEYRVVCNGALTQPEPSSDPDAGTIVLFDYHAEHPEYFEQTDPDHPEHPTHDELVRDWIGSFVINAAKNDGDEVYAYVTVTDNAGNVFTENVGPLQISAYEPEVEVSFDNNDPYTTVGDRGYYQHRTATILITERPSLLNIDNAINGITLTGVDSQGNEVVLNDENVVKQFVGTTVNEEQIDKSVHEFSVEFIANANYDFTLSYTNNADKTCEYEHVTFAEGTRTERYFTVDNVVPTARVTVGENFWTDLLETLTFGLWTNEQYTVSTEAEDLTSPLSIESHAHYGDFAMTEDELAETDWQAYEGDIELTDEQQVTYYFRITDYAGNRIHIDTDGHIIDVTPAAIVISPEETEITLDGIPVYNHDVNVGITVTDRDTYSGIKKVEYWVVSDSVETQREVLYSYEYTRDVGAESNTGTLRIYERGALIREETGCTPAKADLTNEYDTSIIIYADENNNCDVVLHVGVTDNAGNYSEETLAVDIDITPPVIDISYDNNSPYKIVDERGYYPANRTATIVVTERSHHFDGDAVKDSIVVTGVNAKGEAVSFSLSEMTGNWNWVTETNPDDELDTHTLTIAYTVDANYTFSINDDDHPYYDMAGNRCDEVNTGSSVTPFEFTVDKVAPTGTVTVEGYGTWDELIKLLTFGLWSRTAVDVTGTSDDVTSPIESVSYYKTADTTAKTETELAALPESAWAPFNGFTVSPNEQFTVYIRIVDFAGNTTYISTDGVIVDNMAPVEESIAPEITVTPMQPVNGIYNTDVDVAVEVVDPVVGGTYSGLKEIRYEVYNMGSKTQEGVLYRFDIVNPTQAQLLQGWKQTVAFTVDSTKNNSNNVEIKVYAVDNSDNASEDSTEIKIDITNPTISVSYDNNNGDSSFEKNDSTVYFKDNRTATITITERNFDPKDVTVKITNTDGTIPSLNGWTTQTAGGNGDGTTHKATITYSADGDYTFDISCIDLAGNASEPVEYGSSLAPQKFTIDKTAPVLTVTYDVNDVLNEYYYKQFRTATITINEHNFDPSRVKVSITASDDGEPIAVPEISNWTSNGNVHVATIPYHEDGLYTFDIEYADKAGNEIADFDMQKFVVDTIMPEVSIENIVDESANAGSSNTPIGFVVRAQDTNFDEFEPVLTAIYKGDNGFVTEQINDAGVFTEIENGKVFTVDNLDKDGIYRLTCKVVDKAGNAYNEVMLQDSDGKPYTVERSDPEALVTFSVNREGSTYDYGSDYTKYIVDKGYVQSVREDVSIVEINPDPLDVENLVINLNETTLEKDTDYTVELTRSEGNDGWYKYTYTINKDLFAKQNTYRIETGSKDKAGNGQSFSIQNSTDLIFNVDQTAPIVTITGIVNDGRYQTNKQTVVLTPEDPFGQLKSIKVMLVDNEGNTIGDPVRELEGEEFTKMLEDNNGTISFDLDEGLYQNVRIVCDDTADYDPNAEENIIYDETITNVSVASSAFLIYWANKPLRYGTLGGAGAAAAGIGILAFFKKRKKKEDK